MKRQSLMMKGLVYVVLVIGSLFCLFPIFWMVRTSLITMGDLYQIPPALIPKSLSWDNFKAALEAYPFARFFMNSTIITVLAVVGVLFSSSVCAYSFSRIEWKGRDKVFGFILTGLMIPFFVVMIPQYVFWNALHLTDTFAPLVAPAWFGGGVFNIFLLRQFFFSIPRELDEAAKVDGAGHFRIYGQIILPLAKQAMIVIGLLTFLANWNDYLGPLAFITSEKNYTLMQGLTLFQGSYSAQWNLMMAATTVIVIPSLIVFLIAQKHFIEGIAMTGIKG
ncbi:sugar ABC transporter permease [Paenibacillus albidus]|uniref:Sugar ABC transporter permease n=1 Tax=Paenibacillus albidus TaxID=2041023 RepID=A0A917CDG5_9BACL|nr:carbohydrate ABC transporter permease [Paenibacillus albidus]GGF82428.1 sugar ABC transporter permease [Paenibacillus albidus]